MSELIFKLFRRWVKYQNCNICCHSSIDSVICWKRGTWLPRTSQRCIFFRVKKVKK